MAAGTIAGRHSWARLTSEQVTVYCPLVMIHDCPQVLDISRRRGRGVSPMRPHIRREFALAIIWAEAALELAGGEDQQIR